MKTQPLTKEEVAWIKKLDKHLMNPPSDRLGLFTVGDNYLTVYDKLRDVELHENLDNNVKSDFCIEVNNAKAWLGVVKSACRIHSTAG